MKPIILSAICTLTACLSYAQSSLLYELSKPGSAQKSYLFGTIHTQDERAFVFNDSVFWAIDQTTASVFEMKLSGKEGASMPKAIKDYFQDTQLVNKVKNYTSSQFMPLLMEEIPAKDLAYKITGQIMPVYFEMLESVTQQKQRLSFVDQLLQNYSYNRKKKVIGLETVDEQLNALLGDFKTMNLDSMQLAEKLVAYLKKDQFNLELLQSGMSPDTIIKMYHSGNLIEIENFFTSPENIQSYKAFYDRLLVKRNDIMLNRTKNMVANENTFIAVGAGHLIGDNGLIKQYELLGYTVRPMNVLSKTNAKTSWNTIKTDDFKVDLPTGVALKLQDDDYYFSMLSILGDSTKTFHTLYTPKGELSFTVRLDDETEEVEEAMEYIDVEDATGESIEDADEMVDEETVEFEYEEVDSEDYEIVEEITDESDSKEEEEDDIEAYDYDASLEEEEQLYTPRKKPTLLEDSTQNAYLEEVGDSVKGYMKTQTVKMMATMFKGDPPIDTMWSIASPTGPIEINYRSTSFSSSLTRIIETDQGEYTLKMTGDKNMLMDEQYHRFFTQFKLVD